MKISNKSLLIKRVVLFIILAYLLSGCKALKPQVIYQTKDSIITNTITVTKDSIIRVPGDTIKFQIPCDKDTVFITKSKTSSSLVQVKHGIITVQNNCDEQLLIISKLQDKLHHFELQANDSLKTEKIFVKKIPGIYKFTFWGFWVVLAAATVLFTLNKNLWFVLVGAVTSIVKSLKKKS